MGISKTDVLPEFAFYPGRQFRITLFVQEIWRGADMIGRNFAGY
jgi:hypothetical protein